LRKSWFVPTMPPRPLTKPLLPSMKPSYPPFLSLPKS